MINEIYNLYDNSSKDDRREIINLVSKKFSQSKKSIYNNWFTNKFLRSIPQNKQANTLQIIKKYKKI